MSLATTAPDCLGIVCGYLTHWERGALRCVCRALARRIPRQPRSIREFELMGLHRQLQPRNRRFPANLENRVWSCCAEHLQHSKKHRNVVRCVWWIESTLIPRQFPNIRILRLGAGFTPDRLRIRNGRLIFPELQQIVFDYRRAPPPSEEMARLWLESSECANVRSLMYLYFATCDDTAERIHECAAAAGWRPVRLQPDYYAQWVHFVR